MNYFDLFQGDFGLAGKKKECDIEVRKKNHLRNLSRTTSLKKKDSLICHSRSLSLSFFLNGELLNFKKDKCIIIKVVFMIHA